jgi:hypothetical protein
VSGEGSDRERVAKRSPGVGRETDQRGPKCGAKRWLPSPAPMAEESDQQGQQDMGREGCTNSVPSGCFIIFVKQPAESISPPHCRDKGGRHPLEFLLRCLKLQRAVRALAVVVVNVDLEDALEVAAGEDEKPIEAFRPNGPDPSLAAGVGSRCPEGSANHLESLG